MNPEIEQVLREFHQAWQAWWESEEGMTKETEKLLFGALSGELGFPVNDLNEVMQLERDPEFFAAKQRQGGRPAAVDYTAQAFNSALFELPDNLMRFIAPEAGQKFTEMIEDRRLTDPGMSFLASTAGALAPTGAAFRAGTMPFKAAKGVAEGSRAPRSIIGMAGRTGGLTGLQGAATGYGMVDDPEATGQDRIAGLVGGGLIGTAAGTIMGASGGYFRGRAAAHRATGRGRTARIQRETQELAEAGGSPRIYSAEEVAQGMGPRASIPRGPGTPIAPRVLADADELKALGGAGFEELAAKHPEVVDEGVEEFLDSLRKSKDGRALVRAASKDLADTDKFPSFSDLNKLRGILRKNRHPALDELTGIMEQQFGEAFVTANSRWHRGMMIERRFNEGAQALTKRLDEGEVRRTLQQLTESAAGAEAAEAYRMGIVNRAVFDLGRKDITDPTGLLKTLMDMPDDAITGIHSTLRGMFRDTDSYEAFRTLIRNERSAQELLQHINTFARPVMIGLVFGGGMALGGGLSMGGANYFGNLLATTVNN
jgi:hypothetical protein